ncbi:MAG: preprotein translocase subunit SecG [Clostridia bacterium]|nr:preprotein translocase subunit SecG [Clostridia bacterium]
MKQLLSNLLATFELYHAISLVCLILGVLCAIFLIIVVMMQSGNSNGIDALSGSSDTFYGKNKSKTIESKLKKLTVICVILLVVFMIAFYLIQLLVHVPV